MHVRFEAKIKIIVELDIELQVPSLTHPYYTRLKLRLQKWNVIRYMSMFKEQPHKCS